MHRILVSNDDGVHSEGLRALCNALNPLGEVWVVAPDREQSASSHSLTMHRPLRMREMAPRVYAVDGTPTDCILLASHRLFQKDPPSLVVSGINKGSNMGDDIVYSGTVSAAMEGARLGISSFAVSLASRSDFDFGPAADFAYGLARLILSTDSWGPILLNVNVPNLPREDIRGVRFTRQGKSIYNGAIVEKTDPRGERYYWIGGQEPGYHRMGNSDVEAVVDGWISVTPLRLELTDERAMERLKARRFLEDLSFDGL